MDNHLKIHTKYNKQTVCFLGVSLTYNATKCIFCLYFTLGTRTILILCLLQSREHGHAMFWTHSRVIICYSLLYIGIAFTIETYKNVSQSVKFYIALYHDIIILEMMLDALILMIHI